jgi:hypothetical protein
VRAPDLRVGCRAHNVCACADEEGRDPGTPSTEDEAEAAERQRALGAVAGGASFHAGKAPLSSSEARGTLFGALGGAEQHKDVAGKASAQAMAFPASVSVAGMD